MQNKKEKQLGAEKQHGERKKELNRRRLSIPTGRNYVSEERLNESLKTA